MIGKRNSRSLHFGRDDNSVIPKQVNRDTPQPSNRIVIPTEVEGPAVSAATMRLSSSAKRLNLDKSGLWIAIYRGWLLSLSMACFNCSSFWPASPSLPSAVKR